MMVEQKQTNKGHTVWKSLGGNNPDTIGGNSHSYMYTDNNGKTESIVIDFGSLFCDEEKTGYSSVIPDARVHFDKADGSEKAELPASAILITHGHQDHIGGLPHLIKMGYKLPPIMGSKLTLEYVKQILQSQWVKKEEWPELKVVEPNQKLKLGNFEIEPVAVTHSMPNSLGFYIKTPDAKIFHSGDFKSDQTVPVGKPFDKARVEEISKEEINAVMVDSTSVFKSGKVTEEEQIYKNILDIVEENQDKRIVIPVISSSTQRLASIAKVAAATGKTIVLEGASLINSERALKNADISLAKIAGFDESQMTEVNGRATNCKLVVKGGSAYERSLDDSDKIVVCTGTQGEEVSSFYKAVHRNFLSEEEKANSVNEKRPNPFTISKDDCIVMAQTAIPGNEESYYNLLEVVAKDLGAKVYVPKLPDNEEQSKLFSCKEIHASGHGGKGDLEVLYKALIENSEKKDLVVVPVHGSKDHIDENAKFAESLGLKSSKHQNFEGLEISDEGVKPVALKIGEKGLEIEPQKENVPQEVTWIGLKRKSKDWLKPFYDYDKIDSKYKKVESLVRDKVTKKDILKANRDHYRKSRQLKQIFAKKFWRDRD
ncbi:MAG: MBL fold metallo-hydrolase [Alphaproteobacteria bacterium]